MIDGRLDLRALPVDGDLVATHIQIDEINRTSDEERRARLFLTLTSTIHELLPTETTVLDVSRFDWCKLGDGEVYRSIKDALSKVVRSVSGGRRG